jgi:hypothetical protein
MISNGQRSGNRDDIAAEPMDGFYSLRSKQSWHKCSNSATGVDTNLAVLRHDTQNDNDTKRVWRAIPCKTQQIPWRCPATN